MIFVVMDLQLMAQHIGHFGGAGLTVVAESEMLAIAGAVFDHPRISQRYSQLRPRALLCGVMTPLV